MSLVALAPLPSVGTSQASAGAMMHQPLAAEKQQGILFGQRFLADNPLFDVSYTRLYLEVGRTCNVVLKNHKGNNRTLLMLLIEKLAWFHFHLNNTESQAKQFSQGDLLQAKAKKTEQIARLNAVIDMFLDADSTDVNVRTHAIAAESTECNFRLEAAAKACSTISALDVAIEGRLEHIAIKIVLRGAAVNLPHLADGEHPLITACLFKLEKLALVLIEKGANIFCYNRDSLTPIHYACKEFLPGVLRTYHAATGMISKAFTNAAAHLLPHNGIRQIVITYVGNLLTERDKDGNTPLHWAAGWGRDSSHLSSTQEIIPEEDDQRAAECVTFLLNVGGYRLCDITNFQDDTPLHVAAGHNKTHLVRIMLTAGADRSLVNIYQLRRAGIAPAIIKMLEAPAGTYGIPHLPQGGAAAAAAGTAAAP